jgi:hypothetical protein
MYFDAEMVLICVLAILSGVVFYRIASRDPRPDMSENKLCSRQH